MSLSTITLQQVLNFCSTHSDLLPLSGVGGYTNEPGLSLANDAISEIITTSHDWVWNRNELPMLVTAPNKQDYQFGGACAFSLGATSQGWGIALASNNAITVTTGVVTVNFLERHRFNVGDTIYMIGNTLGAYNSTFTDNGSATSWSGGWVITTITATTVTFAATSGQNNGDVTGAPGITNFGWLASASMQEMNNTSSPVNQMPLTAYRELPVISRVALPDKVAVMVDNGDGTLKIRFHMVPGSTTYGANLVYQGKAPLKIALSDTFAPIPDNFGAVIRQALLYRMYRYLNSPTADNEYKKLQAEIMKAVGCDDAAQTDVHLQPEEPLMSMDTWGWW